MLKRKVFADTTLGEVFSDLEKTDSKILERVQTIELVNNFGGGGKEIYVPCHEDLSTIHIAKGALIVLNLDRPPVGGVGFF